MLFPALGGAHPKAMLAVSEWIKFQHVINHVNNSICSRQILVAHAITIYKHATTPVVFHSQDSAAQRIHREVVPKERPIAVHAMYTTRVQGAVDHVMLQNFAQLFRAGEEGFLSPRGIEFQVFKSLIGGCKQS